MHGLLIAELQRLC